ncbi:MAG: rhomboid family intramembrane serine protease [Dehalococcoidia bacterium]|nr:rhomboid family intramembrane serine protease [Dehalococcoidia bacterium]
MRTYRAVNLNALWFLIALNVLIFVITLLRPEAIINFLGLTPALLSQQPWTIISSMFVHGNFGHILFNMISLYFLGSFLIRAAGEKSFLAVFFLGGLAGNILYFVLGYLVLRGFIPPLFGDPFTPGIGASGGIFALGGALAIMVPRVPVIIFPIPVPVPLWVAIIILVCISFLFSGIAWQAHLGGLFLGLVAGLIFKRRRRIYSF